MPYRKEQFVNGDIYHLATRAIDDNLIFKNISDYYRGIFSIYEFNNATPVEIWRRRRDRISEKKKEKLLETRSPTILIDDRRDKFIEILAFCFMPNHVHLLVKQIKDNGITRFMSKFGAGYGGYLNKKYKRKGHVFQDRFRGIHIEDDNQLLIVFNYIHANPLSLTESRYKEKGIKNPKEAIEFLENYKWSSYQDYLDKKNFPSVTSREFLLETIGGVNGCKNTMKNWIEYKKITQNNNLFLD